MKIDTLRSGGQSQGGLDASGGTLTGPLMLPRDPQLPLEAATKRYIDNNLQALNAGNIVTGTLPITRLPAFSGDVVSEAGQNTMSLSNTGVTAGEYGKVVVDAKGRVTNGTGVGNIDIPNISFNKITTGKPTTLSGYGITDAIGVSGGLMTGSLILSGSPVSGEHMVPKQYVDGMTNSLSAAKTGDIVRKSYASTPAGFLKCNGAEISKTTYADLYAIVGDNNALNTIIGNGQPWRNQYEINKDQSADISSWSSTTSYPISIGMACSIVTKNRVYVFGGWNGSSGVSNVYTAPINTDGSIGSWTSGTSLPNALFQTRSVIVKNKVYLIGGATSDNVSTATVLMSNINTDGTIGAWTTSNALPSAMSHAGIFVTNSRIYVAGGVTNSTSNGNVYSCPINSDGTIGSWVTETSLPAILTGSQPIVTKNRVYLLGGNNGGNWVSTVYTATFNADGTVGAWTTGTSLPNTVGYSSVVVTNSRIYLLGGYIGGSYVTTTYTAPLNSDGTIGTWTTGTALSSALCLSNPIIVKNKIYLIGGYLSSAYTGTTLVASFSGGYNDYSPYYEDKSLNYMTPGSGRPWQRQYEFNETQSGNISGWSTSSNLPISVHASQAIVTKNRVYLMGGENSSGNNISTVYTAPINSDGTLGTWATTTSLPDVVSRSQAIITKNRVYLLGGYRNSTCISSVYTAPINADGTLGTWSTVTSLPGALGYSQAIVTKNRVYLCGGSVDATNAVSTVYTAPIGTDGTIGTWTTGPSLPSTLGWSQAVVTKNRVYLLGGWNLATGAVSTVYVATINSDGLLSPWFTGPSLPGNLHWAQVYVAKNIVYYIGGWNNAGTINSVYYTSINSDGTLGTWVAGSNLPISIAVSQLIATKNHVYLLGGRDGSATTISTIYSAAITEGLNDYSAYYDGSVLPLEPVNPTTTFRLPDMSTTDINGIYHYIKY